MRQTVVIPVVLLVLLLSVAEGYFYFSATDYFSPVVPTPRPLEEMVPEASGTITPVPASTATSVQNPVPEVSPIPDSPAYDVVAVIDGDTIDVDMGGVVRRVRYIGMNTPETVHPTRAVECFGNEASDRNKALLLGKRVQLEKDISETDKYGRLLRYVYVDGVLLNERLVAEGYASVSTYPPDVRYTERFLAAERAARALGKGLWGAGCAVYHSPSSLEGGGGGEAKSSGGSCSIKGNVNEAGERIYHVPGCEYYGQTVITEAKGERWFCSEAEAQAVGWRKAFNCP